MQVFGSMHTLKITCANDDNAEQDVDSIVSSEKLLKFTPTQDVYLLLTPKSKSTAADNDDYLLKANVEVEFLVGRGLDRIAIRNESGSSANIHVAILY